MTPSTGTVEHSACTAATTTRTVESNACLAVAAYNPPGGEVESLIYEAGVYDEGIYE